MKKQIAIIVPGGIGIEHHIPSLLHLLHELSSSYTLHLYSLSCTDLHPLLQHPDIHYTSPAGIFSKNRTLSVIFIFCKIGFDQLKKHFDVIHGFWILPAGFIAAIIGKLFRLPTVITIPGGDIVRIPRIQYGGMKTPLHRSMIRWCCRSAEKIIVLTHFQHEIMRRNKITARDISIIPYGVDIKQYGFRPRPISSPLNIVSIGNINEVKDVFTQIQTVALLSRTIDCRLTIVGPDILNGKTQAYAKELNIIDKIQWIGKQKYSEIPALLQSSHLLLHTSLYDAQAVVIMEAFASGTMVVGTRVGLLADTDTENSHSAEPENAKALAEIILALINNPMQRQTMQKRNREYAERFNNSWTASEYRNVYQKVIDKRE